MAENRIIENDFELSEEDLRACIKNIDKADAEFSTIRELEQISTTNIDFSKLALEIQKIKPKNHEQFVSLLKLTAVYFLHANSLFETRRKNDSLWYVLQFEISNLFDAAAKLIVVLKTNRNILYFSRKMSHVNENGRLLGCLLVWELSYRLLGEETAKCIPQFHSFSSLMCILDNVDIDLLPANVNILHMLLECISFLLNAIVVSPIKSPEYSKHLEFTLNDMSSLKEWVSKIHEKFPVSSNFENDVDINAKISEMIDFIIKDYVNTVLKDSSISLVCSQDMSFNDSPLKENFL